ncbi:MAG: MazG nucleotide pyrophosphohydrolase domain-containing protein [Atopococcus tabaci]|uniref:MazG nucleotide pyrophosphohydrolase domain-containing protein n=1 Tax=Atopococcus tabaci TaxID=269774 RepID=A0AA43UBZ2_9LACT|nr:MazG nucleotide pyrophosphohydrolase domain-containing protein [Atopococcus tabaci]
MGKIEIIGLGPGDFHQMPIGSYDIIKKSEHVYLRTEDHPAVAQLKEKGHSFKTYDFLYEKFNEDFEKVYPAIVDDLLEKSKNQDIVYAVPGHPMVAELTTQLLLQNDTGTDVKVMNGHSFIDDLFSAVQADPVEGFQLVDGLDFQVESLSPDQHLIIMQVYHPMVAGDVKLDLMKIYPDDYPVARVDAAGSSQETVTWVPLYELDFFEGVHNLLSVYLPPLSPNKNWRSFARSRDLTDQIFDFDQGDLWVLNQDHKSLWPYLEEESEELRQAIEEDDIDNMIEELGDVLLQVLYHSKVAENEGFFSLEDILESLNQKLYRRHPNVFGELEVDSIEELEQLWEDIKKDENGE